MFREISVNVRCLRGPGAGVQRYTREILRRLPDDLLALEPGFVSGGIAGHLWEQSVLPFRAGGRLLWSPANTGPLFYTNQVVTVHDMACFDHPEWFHPWFARWYRTLIPRLVKRVRHVITDSKFSRGRILNHTEIDPEKITVVYGGVDGMFSPVAQERIEAHKVSLGLSEESYVLSVGSLEPRKNLAGLLEAWKRSLDSLPPDCWLLVAGPEGSDRVFGQLELPEIPDRVRFLGHVSDKHLPRLYAGAELFVYPSLYEGFGLPVLEAMACGTPVLVSEDCPVNEVVRADVTNVDPRNIGAIQTKMVELIKDRQKRKQMADRGPTAVRGYTWDASADRMRDCLNQFR